jgi:hypothetical protein
MWYKIFLPISALLFWAACEKNTLNADTDSVNRPVVEAFLQPGAVPVVFVKKQIPYNGEDTLQLPITDLYITIEQVESGEQYLLQHSDSSAYVGSGWYPQSGKTYRLRFEYAGETIESETVIPDKPVDFQASALSIQAFDPSGFTPGSGTPPAFPDPIELNWDATDGGYYLVVVESAEDDPELIFSDTTQFRPFRAFRSTPAQTNVYELNVMSFRYYGAHHVILYHLNPEYAALYESYGSNSTNLSTPYSNVSGGLGIFTGVCADTLVVTVTQ